MEKNNQTTFKKKNLGQLVPVKEYALFYELPPSRVLVAAKIGKLKSAKK